MRNAKPISKTFQYWLLICVLAAFCVTFSFTYILQTNLTRENSQNILELNIADIISEIELTKQNYDSALISAKQNALAKAYAVKNTIDENYLMSESDDEFLNTKLQTLLEEYGVAEINIVNKEGIIVSTTEPKFIGYDMSSGTQSAEFLALLNGSESYVQDYQPTSYDSSMWRMYAGVTCDIGFVQIGYDAENLAEAKALADMSNVASDRHVGETGHVIILDEENNIISGEDGYIGLAAAEAGIDITDLTDSDDTFGAVIYGEPSLCIYTQFQDYGIIATMTDEEIYFPRNVFAYEIAFMEIVLFAVIFVLIFLLLKRLVVDNVHKINRSLARITSGDLNVAVDVRESEEFVSLSNDINSTVDALKRYIAEAEARIDEELKFAKEIQHSALPANFNPFPNSDTFELFAAMDTAKEVGGDFYDFFPVDGNHLALVIADVSGKGIPAALFMMKCKTLIKSLAESGLSPADVLTAANKELIEGNDGKMFVTVWLGIFDIHSGRMLCANAGHEYPVIKRAGEKFELLKDKHGFVLAGMENTVYRQYELNLDPGDSLYLYTDGVTEATDAKNGLFGTARMLEALNSEGNKNLSALLKKVKSDIDVFVGSAPQFDDITMMAIRMKAVSAAERFSVEPSFSGISQAAEFAENYFTQAGCSAKTIMQLNIVVDEVLSNIIKYSGASEITMSCHAENKTAKLIFFDNGKPYNPLESREPEISAPAEGREIGGLGILLVRKTMDDCFYRYEDERNIFSVEKTFD